MILPNVIWEAGERYKSQSFTESSECNTHGCNEFPCKGLRDVSLADTAELANGKFCDIFHLKADHDSLVERMWIVLRVRFERYRGFGLDRCGDLSVRDGRIETHEGHRGRLITRNRSRSTGKLG